MIFHSSLCFGADSHCFYVVLFARALMNSRPPFYFAHATYSICLSLFRQGKELVELLDPQWIRLRRPQVFPALERMCNKSMIQTGHMLEHDFCAGEASGRRNPSGSVNQSDNYAQRPRETVSMSLKEIVS